LRPVHPQQTAPAGRKKVCEAAMNVEAILRSKGRSVTTIRPQETVGRAVAALRAQNIGALVVSEDGERVEGIVSERDIMNRVVAVGRTAGTTAVSEVMTPNPRAVHPDENIEECLFIMREFGFRHLPIVDGKELKGLVSLRDVLMHQAAEIERQTRRVAS
jgi:CBS domain-containing protein